MINYKYFERFARRLHFGTAIWRNSEQKCKYHFNAVWSLVSPFLLGISLLILTALVGSVSVIVFWRVKRTNIKNAKERIRALQHRRKQNRLSDRTLKFWGLRRPRKAENAEDCYARAVAVLDAERLSSHLLRIIEKFVSFSTFIPTPVAPAAEKGRIFPRNKKGRCRNMFLFPRAVESDKFLRKSDKNWVKLIFH